MFEYKYRTQEKHTISAGTAPLSLEPIPTPPEKEYTLTLHFTELDDVEPGERVFDVRAQGRILFEGIDIVKEAGGALRPLVKQRSGISGTEYLDLEFVPHKGSLPPVLSGLELKKL
jgi:beta-galactosidase